MNDTVPMLEGYLNKIISNEPQAARQPVIDPQQVERLKAMEKAEIDRIGNQSIVANMDLTPLYQLADMWGKGTSNLTSGYRPPKSRANKVAEIRNAYKTPQQGSQASASNELLRLVGAAKEIESLKNNGLSEENQLDLDYKKTRNQIAQNKLNGNSGSSPSSSVDPYKLSKGQEMIDKEFAKMYAEDFVAGKINEAKSNISKISDVSNMFKGGKNLTGAFTMIPGQEIFFPDSKDAQQNVESVIMGSLRATLGAQFTEKEGTRILEATYNPRLPEELIAKRLDRLQTKLKAIIESRQNAGKYFQNNGTLKGFDAVGGMRMNPGSGLADELISSITAEGKSSSKRNGGQVGPANKVTVTNGSETLRIDRSRLEEAMQDGFSVEE